MNLPGGLGFLDMGPSGETGSQTRGYRRQKYPVEPGYLNGWSLVIHHYS